MTLMNKCFYMFTHFVYKHILYINYTLTITKVNNINKGQERGRIVKNDFKPKIIILLDAIFDMFNHFTQEHMICYENLISNVTKGQKG